MAADKRRALGLPATGVVLAMVGDDLVARGFERVLFAIAAMPADAREQLRLVASGRLPSRFLKAARVLGLAEHVRVCKAPPDAVLAAADILVDLPYRESTNATVLDAVNLGRVVFTTQNVAESKFVREAQAGVVLPLPYVQAACNRALLECVRATVGGAPCANPMAEARQGERMAWAGASTPAGATHASPLRRGSVAASQRFFWR